MRTSLPSAARALMLSFLFALVVGCAHRGAPSVYPKVDATAARPTLAVVELLATDYLPPFPQCESRDVICMDPPPTWVRFRTLQTVYGEPMPERFYASTTSHYGKMDAYGLAKGPMLVLLLTQDGSTVLPRYARANLQTDSAGERHLVLTREGPHWLPCSVAALGEPIVDARLRRRSAVAIEDYRQFHADTSARYFRVEGDAAHPLKSVPMGRLQAHLAGRTLAAADFACPRADR